MRVFTPVPNNTGVRVRERARVRLLPRAFFACCYLGVALYGSSKSRFLPDTKARIPRWMAASAEQLQDIDVPGASGGVGC